MWFWYITQARLEGAERERVAQQDRLARGIRKGRVAQSEPLAPHLQVLLRIRQAVHHA
ncbi:MAG: hypothetical protein ACRDGL_09345 [Candidatus Limnocylindrales bacterium]